MHSYWIHFTARFDGVHSFGYNSAESEPIRRFGWNLEHCVSALSGAGSGGFWARSAQRQWESQAKLCFFVR